MPSESWGVKAENELVAVTGLAIFHQGETETNAMEEAAKEVTGQYAYRIPKRMPSKFMEMFYKYAEIMPPPYHLYSIKRLE